MVVVDRRLSRGNQAMVGDDRVQEDDLDGAVGDADLGKRPAFEMTWADDGRATFQYGEFVTPGEPHVIWRRVGTHSDLQAALAGTDRNEHHGTITPLRLLPFRSPPW